MNMRALSGANGACAASSSASVSSAPCFPAMMTWRRWPPAAITCDAVDDSSSVDRKGIYPKTRPVAMVRFAMLCWHHLHAWLHGMGQVMHTPAILQMVANDYMCPSWSDLKPVYLPALRHASKSAEPASKKGRVPYLRRAGAARRTSGAAPAPSPPAAPGTRLLSPPPA